MNTSVAVSMAEQLTVRIDDDLVELMQEFQQQHEFPPNKSEVVRAALREYLENRVERDNDGSGNS